MLEKSLSEFKKWIKLANLNENDHQIEGIKWCLQREFKSNSLEDDNSIFYSKPGGIIADEMGLGKTILSLGLIYSNFLDKTLIVVPPSLIPQWVKQFQNLLGHTPTIYHGVNKSKITDEELENAKIVITSYAHISSYKINKTQSQTTTQSQQQQTEASAVALRTLHKIKWSRVIFDEAHHMRNQKMSFSGAQRLKTDICWMLTGTPIHNKISDMKAYFQLLKIPNIFIKNQNAFPSICKEVLMRRTKEEANLTLPTINEHLIEVEWTSEKEKDLAEQIHAEAGLFNVTRENVDKAIKYIGQHILTKLLRSRQVCILPSMIKYKLDEFQKSNPLEKENQGVFGNSKMKSVISTLLERQNNNRKKLVFCHYRNEIDQIYEIMKANNISCEFFDGRVSSAERQQILQNSPDVLILQTQTACEGLNLQQYQEVYFVSPHWNPSVEDQAIGRCHRIGQTQEIDIFRFAMNNFGHRRGVTLDNYCLLIQKLKREMRSVIETK